MAKKRRFGKKLTAFREAVNKLEPAHRVPHVVTILGVAMGLTIEKVNEEIGLASAMFGHLKPAVKQNVSGPWCALPAGHQGECAHTSNHPYRGHCNMVSF